MKKCRKCGAEKSIDLFYRDAQNPDGRCNQCKTCVDARKRRYRAANLARVKAYEAEYYQINRERIIARQIAYNKNLRRKKS